MILIDEIASISRQWNQTLTTLFQNDSGRASRFVAEGAGLRLDYSKHWLDSAVLSKLFDLLDTSDFFEKRLSMFAGDRINSTENRAVLHVALRGEPTDKFAVDGSSVTQSVIQVRNQAYAFANGIRQGIFVGATGEAFTDVVNIGIGGSDLGPLMVAEALKPMINGPRLHYVSNVDGAHLHDVLVTLDPHTTLILIASKTFTTQETMHNAAKAKQWISSALGENAIAEHFAALSSNVEAVRAFGIAETRVFRFWNWVGGRYSVWSTIGLSLMIAMGSEVFDRLLSGAREMDRHFRNAPADHNIPILMALIGMWYRNGFGLDTQAILPYEQRLHRFPAYLQQMEMESNGKRVDRAGEPLDYDTCPVIWGEPGTTGQHAFFQLLHQGTMVCPVDFILTANSINTDNESHSLLNANCLAQAEALAFGNSSDKIYEELLADGLSRSDAIRLASHRSFPGNRPSSLIMMDALTPENLGALIAAYEHKVFTQGILWDINSFDQWGVELGKAHCNALRPSFESGDASKFSTSTQESLKWLLEKKY